ncbi:MAG: type IX secretion system membrane protein PorP/SprF [Bacteroidia bacterium]
MKQSYKLLYLLMFCAFIFNKINAQQDAHFTQFMFNKLWLNPGFAGDNEKICATLLQRNQWVGFGGGSEPNGPQGQRISRGATPENLIFSLNSRIGEKIGVGLLFYRDALGFEQTISVMPSISYRHMFPNQSVLSTGVTVGYMQKTLRGSELKALEPDDPLIPLGDVSGGGLDINFGAYYTMPQLSIFDNFYAGLSATHLNQSQIQYANYNKYDNALHYYLMTGAEYVLNSELTLMPNILVKKDPAKIQADINCLVEWNQKIRGGLTWRPIDAISIILGYNFLSNFTVGYSYDLTTSKILNYSSGSHEIMLRYCFGIKTQPRVKVITPRLTPRFM